MSDRLVEAIQQAIEVKESAINTSCPGTIISYNAVTNRAIVQPDLPKRMSNGTVVQAPVIIDVPVKLSASGVKNGKQAALTFPIAPGDGVELTFQQRSIEGWLSGKNTAPTDPRQFDLSDCVADLGLNAAGVAGDPNNVVLRFDKAIVTLYPDNSIVMGNENASITITEAGQIILQGISVVVQAGGKTVVVEDHRHIDVQAGIDISGPPP